jgi:hypothetical protein
MRLSAQVKGEVDSQSDLSVSGIKRRLLEGLDGRSLTWLAEKTGDPYKNVQRWVTGKIDPPVDFVARYCKVTDNSADWVMLDYGPRKAFPPGEAQETLAKILGQIPRHLLTYMARPPDEDG